MRVASVSKQGLLETRRLQTSLRIAEPLRRARDPYPTITQPSDAKRRFEDDDRPLVIFGQSLGPSDKHLVEMIKQSPDRRLAYAVYPTNQFAVNSERASIEQLLGRADIDFFDSTTHPLGDPALRTT
jgi:hypothetical protein